MEAEKIGGRFGHEGGELVEANDTVAIAVGLGHHRGELVVGEGMAHLGHGAGELRRRDIAVAVTVEGAEDLEQLLLVDENLLVEVGHDGVQELVELDVSVAVFVHVGEQSVYLIAGGFDSEGAEEGRQLEVREAAVGVHVEAFEYVAELFDLVGFLH